MCPTKDPSGEMGKTLVRSGEVDLEAFVLLPHSILPPSLPPSFPLIISPFHAISFFPHSKNIATNEFL